MSMENQTEEQEFTLEEAFERLEEIAAGLEKPDTTLEDSFLLYRQGIELLRACTKKLDLVEKKMLQLNEDGSLTDFHEGVI